MKEHRILVILLVSSLTLGIIKAQLTPEQLLEPRQQLDQWLTYGGGYDGWRYSRLDQINSGNVQYLTAQWAFQTHASGSLETTPLVMDGVIYITGTDNHAYGLDARTGRELWHYRRALPEKLRLCCGKVNRGFALLGSKLFMGTLDAHVIALNAKTGSLHWDVEAEDYRKGYSFTVAPLAVKDKVIVGVSGGEYGIRGFIDAYQAETGKRAWRFYTIPGPGEPGSETWQGDSWKTGGAPAWVTGAFDPELNLIYWGTGNPGPDLYGEERKGDNLYSDSVVALHADTGRLKWHFQFTPHDVHDWDATEVPILLNAEVQGRPRKVLVQANRNGFFYVLDRTNGQFLLAKPFAHVTWAREIDRQGRPVTLPGTDPTPEGAYVCPDVTGATNWMSPSYNPQTGLVYVSVREQCETYFGLRQSHRKGQVYFGSLDQPVSGESPWGALRAIDPRTAEIKWEFKYYSDPSGGTLSTAGGLVFAGNSEGYLIALEARTGKNLWYFQTGAAVRSAPISYALDGKQYILVPSGTTLLAFALPDSALTRRR